jgi:Excalibur calcium-binding domain
MISHLGCQGLGKIEGRDHGSHPSGRCCGGGNGASGVRNQLLLPELHVSPQGGRGDIEQGTPHYCPSQDRDNDGIACEWK